ncbi:hypothetical protein Pmani_015113 [Petrolisthes manimaculis]|uniref:Uncharacterized protein n=1 Tax=Petrolisthes manimaculis TaxID=1843537 RepID=A0AAE1UA93_9EUCA|nr:hypothetical protein Pmani_015113 [Petrolisthes manimaculis]
MAGINLKSLSTTTNTTPSPSSLPPPSLPHLVPLTSTTFPSLTPPCLTLFPSPPPSLLHLHHLPLPLLHASPCSPHLHHTFPFLPDLVFPSPPPLPPSASPPPCLTLFSHHLHHYPRPTNFNSTTLT